MPLTDESHALLSLVVLVSEVKSLVISYEVGRTSYEVVPTCTRYVMYTYEARGTLLYRESFFEEKRLSG